MRQQSCIYDRNLLKLFRSIEKNLILRPESVCNKKKEEEEEEN